MSRAELVVVEPAGSRRVGSWTVYEWPEHAAGAGRSAAGGLAAMRLPLSVPAGTSFLRNGWQSWSPTCEDRLGGHIVRAALDAPINHPLVAPPYDGDESYDVLAADGFVAGFIEGGGVLVARPRAGELLAVRERHGSHPAVWTAAGDRASLLEDLLRRTHGRAPGRTPRGWCTWYCRFADISADTVTADLRGAAAIADALTVFQIDDGYQQAVGDWLATNDRFPSGLATLARQVADAGFRPGLWTAPFIVAEQAKPAADHPDWLLRRPDGERVWAAWNAHWGGNVYALDLSRPDVLRWVEELYRQLAALGFTYLKLDFLYAAAMQGERAAPTSGADSLRRGLEAIRRGAGDDAFLLGCGCPLWPAIGIVDGMRIGPDVAPYWRAGEVEGLEAAARPSLENARRAAVARAPFHGRLWANDPDCVMLRRRHTELTVEQSRDWARWIAASGQMLVLSDRFEDLDAEDVALWRELS
jgi:alpha-galactosidase